MTTIREIKILKTLLHTNVVPILDMVVQPRKISGAIRRVVLTSQGRRAIGQADKTSSWSSRSWTMTCVGC